MAIENLPSHLDPNDPHGQGRLNVVKVGVKPKTKLVTMQ